MTRKPRPPGRPNLGDDGDPTKRLPVDVPQSSIDKYKDAAEVADMTLSEWVRRTLGREARRLLRRRDRER